MPLSLPPRRFPIAVVDALAQRVTSWTKAILRGMQSLRACKPARWNGRCV